MSLFLKTPNGKVGLFNLIVQAEDPTMKIKSYFLMFIAPFIIGLMINLFFSDKIIFSLIAPLLGSFFSVSTAFFQPKLLDPKLRKKIGKARIFYLLLVITYGLLGFSGGLFSYFFKIIRDDSLSSDILTNFIWSIIGTSATIAMQLFSTRKYKNIFPKAKEEPRKGIKPGEIDTLNIKRIINWEIQKSVTEVTAIALNKDFETLSEYNKFVIDMLQEHLKDIGGILGLVKEQEEIRLKFSETTDYKSTYSYTYLVDKMKGYLEREVSEKQSYYWEDYEPLHYFN